MIGFRPRPEKASSVICVLPKMITPWFCKLSTKVALFLAFSLLVRDDPPPVSFPFISAKSFTDIGIPSRIPFLNPTLALFFDSLAEARADFL